MKEQYNNPLISGVQLAPQIGYIEKSVTQRQNENLMYRTAKTLMTCYLIFDFNFEEYIRELNMTPNQRKELGRLIRKSIRGLGIDGLEFTKSFEAGNIFNKIRGVEFSVTTKLV